MTNLRLIFIFIILSSLSFPIFAQVNGNGNIVTEKYTAKPFQSLLIDFPATAIIDCEKEPGLEITTDKNIFKAIGIFNENGELRITQDKWLEATNGVKIIIGAKGLEKVETGGYGVTTIKNISNENFELINPVGEVSLSGNATNFTFESHKGEIDATGLKTDKITAKITGAGLAKIGTFKSLNSEISKNGRLIKSNDDTEISELIEAPKTKLPKPKYIEIKIQNNSFSYLNTVVAGPRNKKFSYGLAFLPYQKKKEKWPVGTQLFEEKADGTRVLLTTITDSDEGNIVKIYR